MSTGDAADIADDKRMRLRYAGRCRECGADLPAGTQVVDVATVRARIARAFPPA
ncbi:hypothetical protein [Terrabacter aerolatus]|uniref:hypothetical protein n=1 Tax=Terrabacter aerolatus TaxID=422442 RepID=UPI001649910D|nr:hypothetical protein [Terrabacter aerolatus]